MTGFALLAAALAAGWFAASWLPVKGVEEPAYRLVEKKDIYEIREYDPYVTAETYVAGRGGEARNEGFRRLAGYIFGDNIQRRKVPMTAPVLRADGGATKLPMTAPVLAAEDGEGTVLSFVMPAGETLESLPQPKNPAVVLRSVSRQRIAVLDVPLHPSAKKVEAGRKRLAEALRRDGFAAAVDIRVAYYNPPWTIPFMRRTEIMALLEDPEEG